MEDKTIIDSAFVGRQNGACRRSIISKHVVIEVTALASGCLEGRLVVLGLSLGFGSPAEKQREALILDDMLDYSVWKLEHWAGETLKMSRRRYERMSPLNNDRQFIRRGMCLPYNCTVRPAIVRQQSVTSEVGPSSRPS